MRLNLKSFLGLFGHFTKSTVCMSGSDLSAEISSGHLTDAFIKLAHRTIQKFGANAEEIATYAKNRGSWYKPVLEWNVVDYGGQTWQIHETPHKCDAYIDWRLAEGKRLMTFCRRSCSRGTAVIRSAWAKNIGLLVGFVVPHILSSG